MTDRRIPLLAGVVERDRILAQLADNHPLYLTLLRAYAREIAAVTGSVTIDEVRAKAIAHELPLPRELKIDERVFGAVFRTGEFEKIGERVSSRPERIERSGRGASYVFVYRLRRRAA